MGRIAAVAALVALALAGDANAQATVAQDSGGSPLVIVFDVSGSMDEAGDDGRVKIEGAKSALLGFLKAVEPGTPIGLRTYPEGSSGCDEGLVRFDISQRDPASMAAEIRTLAAQGRHPDGRGHARRRNGPEEPRPA